MTHRGISTSLAAGAIIVVVVVAAGAFFLLGGIGGGGGVSTTGITTTPTTTTPTTTATTSTSTTSSTTSQGTVPPGLQNAFNDHLQKIGTRDIPTVLTDYQLSAVVLWQGNAQGLQGTYSGVGNIRLLYAAALGSASKVVFNGSAYKAIVNTSSEETVTANLVFSGSSTVLGPFNGTATANVDYVYLNGAWRIKQETWTFNVFSAANASEATTFPQWQRVGSINPNRRSPDWLHNFAWDYGGPGTAALLYVFIGAIAISLAVTRLRRG